MNKTELIRLTAKKAHVTKEKAAEVLEAAMEIVADGLEAGEDLKLKGFGTLELRQRKQRGGINFHTGEKLIVAARRLVAFVPSRELKARINKQEGK